MPSGTRPEAIAPTTVPMKKGVITEAQWNVYSRDGYLYLLQEEPGEELRDKVQSAAELCPTAAITVTD